MPAALTPPPSRAGKPRVSPLLTTIAVGAPLKKRACPLSPTRAAAPRKKPQIAYAWTLSNTNLWSRPIAAAPPLPPATTSGTLPPNITQQKLASPPPVPTANFSPPPAGPHTNPLSTLRAHQKNSTTFPTQQDPIQTPAATANLMQLYYAYFHASHPFCLPPAYLIKTNAVQLTVLLPVMRYIASVFSRTAPTDSFRLEAESALFGVAHPPPRNAFTVQALLLFAIGLHSENESDRASQVKDIAADLALELGMNQAEFSAGGGGDGPAGEMARVLNESWRRTWWELYFIDGLIAGIHQRGAFKLWSVECTVPLPCEEADYAAGRIPEPHSLQEFDDRYFATDNTVFSSFSYRVEAVRILGQVLAVGTGGVSDDTRADAADAGLANWGLHLPRVKKELVGGDRRVDEMLFQAHMVINAAIIYLNRPKSHLAISLIPDSTTVTPPTTWSPPTKPIALHTARTLLAANAISKLLTLPTPLVKHTPFFTCIITLACIVHLSACSWLLSGDEAFLAKERIRLGVGALKGLDGTWGVAAEVLGQVKWVARECFALEEGEGGGVVGGVGGGAAEAEEVLRYLEEERAMGEEAWGADAGGVVGALALPVGGVEWDGT
ncbi:hypothetical protein EDC01DRAFT_181902 [Geopyxis carbonaria]|nr:hypothetical protein EDC01DRAFT_181902 [Geopyxis carbonaria]